MRARVEESSRLWGNIAGDLTPPDPYAVVILYHSRCVDNDRGVAGGYLLARLAV